MLFFFKGQVEKQLCERDVQGTGVSFSNVLSFLKLPQC